MPNQPQEEISLRKFVDEDAEKILQMSREESLARFLPDQVYQDYEEASNVLKYLIRSYDETAGSGNRPYVLGVILNKSRELIGHVGISKIEDGFEIGYAIEKKHQGFGYAKKAVAKMLHFLETTTKLNEIFGIVDPENTPSMNILEKSGFSKTGSRSGRLIYRKDLARPSQ